MTPPKPLSKAEEIKIGDFVFCEWKGSVKEPPFYGTVKEAYLELPLMLHIASIEEWPSKRHRVYDSSCHTIKKLPPLAHD